MPLSPDLTVILQVPHFLFFFFGGGGGVGSGWGHVLYKKNTSSIYTLELSIYVMYVSNVYICFINNHIIHIHSSLL